MINKLTAKRIKAALKYQQMSQGALADEWGIAFQMLNNVINGKIEHSRVEERLLKWLDSHSKRG